MDRLEVAQTLDRGRSVGTRVGLEGRVHRDFRRTGIPVPLLQSTLRIVFAQFAFRVVVLVAAYQDPFLLRPPSLVAIEEPETSLHPAAMHALVDATDEATGRTQILLTTHSTELLDNPTIKPENVRVVEMMNGETIITPVDEASVEIVKQKLDTLGGLERQNQLEQNLDDEEGQRKLAAGTDSK